MIDILQFVELLLKALQGNWAFLLLPVTKHSDAESGTKNENLKLSLATTTFLVS